MCRLPSYELRLEAHRAGIPVVAGSDMLVPGHSLHRELELYVEAGLTPMDGAMWIGKEIPIHGASECIGTQRR